MDSCDFHLLLLHIFQTKFVFQTSLILILVFRAHTVSKVLDFQLPQHMSTCECWSSWYIPVTNDYFQGVLLFSYIFPCFSYCIHFSFSWRHLSCALGDDITFFWAGSKRLARVWDPRYISPYQESQIPITLGTLRHLWDRQQPHLIWMLTSPLTRNQQWVPPMKSLHTLGLPSATITSAKSAKTVTMLMHFGRSWLYLEVRLKMSQKFVKKVLRVTFTMTLSSAPVWIAKRRNTQSGWPCCKFSSSSCSSAASLPSYPTPLSCSSESERRVFSNRRSWVLQSLTY